MRKLTLVPGSKGPKVVVAPDEPYVPPSHMFPTTPAPQCRRCYGPLLPGSPVMQLTTDVRTYHAHLDCPEAYDE